MDLSSFKHMIREQLYFWPELDPLYRKEKDIDWIDISTLPDDPERKTDRQLSSLPTGKYILFKTGGPNLYLKDKGLIFPYVKNTFKNLIIYPKGHGTDAYPRIGLRSKQGKTFNFKIHRLAGIAFIENPEKKPIVNHINENVLDYELKNLNWKTISENSKGTKRGAYKVLSGTLGENLLNLAKKGTGL